MDAILSFRCLLATVLLLSFGVNSSPVPSALLARPKRSDDTSPLTALVDRLSQQISSMNAELGALKARAARAETSAAFYVWHNTKPLTVAAKGTLVMNHVATNVGNGYNPSTGIFTVPQSGLYDFQASLMPYIPAAKVSYAGIYVDDQLVSLGIADSAHNFWDQSTIRAIVHVTSGQRVCVKNPSTVATAYFSAAGEPYTSFSGFLISAD